MFYIYIDIPNCPQKALRLAIVDGRINQSAEKTLSNMGIDLIKTEKHADVHEAVSFHPDMILHHLGGKDIVYAPNTAGRILQELEDHGFNLIEGQSKLQEKYPADIAYNVARVGKFYFHNLKYTDPVIKKELEKRGVEPINIKQGYAKCSISVVDENSIITADKAIAKAAMNKGIDVLLIENHGEIALPGMNCGFIGGSTGLVDKKSWAVFGDYKKLNSAGSILEFLSKKEIQVKYLGEGQVFDYGSLLPILEE
jgi:predicted Fe-Mo cluster-binding NifX family protein